MKEFTYKVKSMKIKDIIYKACSFMLEGNEFQIKKTFNIIFSLADEKDSLKSYMMRLDDLEKMISRKNSEKDKDGVILSTIHGSKGLEYNVVYIADLYDGVLPTRAA